MLYLCSKQVRWLLTQLIINCLTRICHYQSEHDFTNVNHNFRYHIYQSLYAFDDLILFGFKTSKISAFQASLGVSSIFDSIVQFPGDAFQIWYQVVNEFL